MNPSDTARDRSSAPPAPTPTNDSTPVGAGRVLTVSTIGFTLMFAAWLMFGVVLGGE